MKLDHLFSQSPMGIWNQMYIALITVALVEIMRLLTAPDKSSWAFLTVIQAFLFEPKSRLKGELVRKRRQSRGRQKVPIPIEKQRQYGEDFAIVSPINRQHFLDKEKEKKRKQRERQQAAEN